jgi:hypothetical protein
LTCAGGGGSANASTTVTVSADSTITVVATKTTTHGGGSLDLWSLGGLLAVGIVGARRKVRGRDDSEITLD